MSGSRRNSSFTENERQGFASDSREEPDFAPDPIFSAPSMHSFTSNAASTRKAGFMVRQPDRIGICADNTHAELGFEIKVELQKKVRWCSVSMKPGWKMVMFVAKNGRDQWTEWGDTGDHVHGSTIHFEKRINASYYANRGDLVQFSLQRRLSPNAPFEKFATCETSMHQLLSSNTFEGTLLDVSDATRGSLGKLRVYTTQGYNNFAVVELTLRAERLPNADPPPSKSDPYFELVQRGSSPYFGDHLLARSEVIENSLSPCWSTKTFLIHWDSTQVFSINDIPLVLKIYDRDHRSEDDFLASTTCSLKSLTCYRPIPMKLEYKTLFRRKVPQVTPTYMKISRPRPHTEFFNSGCRIRVGLAVDPRIVQPLNVGLCGNLNEAANPYVTLAVALKKVGQGLAQFLVEEMESSVNLYWGSSYHVAPDLSHISLNRLQGHGAEAIAQQCCRPLLEARNAPDFMASVLNAAASYSISPCVPNEQDLRYDILILFTNGCCDQKAGVKQQIVEMSRTHPLLILLVGICGTDYSFLRELDGDNQCLQTENGKSTAVVDVVDFIEYDESMNYVDFAAYLLKELPAAVSNYFFRQRIEPGNAN